MVKKEKEGDASMESGCEEEEEDFGIVQVEREEESDEEQDIGGEITRALVKEEKPTRVVPYNFGARVSKQATFADCTVEELQSLVIKMRKGGNAADIQR